ncbi:hypothetical protein [Nguyenibacter vanlangensis]|uniref:Uncharacterized protein n=1 Tax=Nguyenibacter vanlangensis TaxID=1216886 RepID=A0A7Y7IUA9_9PROT|nr:hypothetical protein [Nguyenibacter vanlangensis]NVN10430.1 hypothetical protein [Nguyenibacter vanlangensis]
MAPHVMANFGLTYDDSHFFGFTNLTGAMVRTMSNGITTNLHPVTLIDGEAGPGATGGTQFYTMPRFTMTGTISTTF